MCGFVVCEARDAAIYREPQLVKIHVVAHGLMHRAQGPLRGDGATEGGDIPGSVDVGPNTEARIDIRLTCMGRIRHYRWHVIFPSTFVPGHRSIVLSGG